MLYPSLNSTEEDFLSLLWIEDGLEYEIHCLASMNENVEVQGSSLVFKDEEGEEVVITPLFPRNLV